jgi:hypothetical protein
LGLNTSCPEAWPGRRLAYDTEKSWVAITHNRDIGKAIDEALGHFDRDLKPLFRGKIVAVHPNDTLADKKDKAAVTQPDALRDSGNYEAALAAFGSTCSLFQTIQLLQVKVICSPSGSTLALLREFIWALQILPVSHGQTGNSDQYKHTPSIYL